MTLVPQVMVTPHQRTGHHRYALVGGVRPHQQSRELRYHQSGRSCRLASCRPLLHVLILSKPM
jgi:hypothetical protein